MSDTSQGPGWWMASDGKWYPPTATAGGPPNQQENPPTARTLGNLWQRFRRLPMAAQVVSWAVVALILIVAISSGASKKPTHPISATAATTAVPATTVVRPTTTMAPATTAPPTTTVVTAPPTTVAPVSQAPVVTSPPVTAAPTPVAPASSCYPTTSSGNCYEPGEYCPTKDYGMTGVAGDGKQIKCENNNGWRWEPIS